MSPRPETRPAAAADVPALARLAGRYWAFEGIDGFDPDRAAAALVRLFADPALGAAWIAEVDGRPVGYLLAVFVFSLEHGGLTAEIDEFFVDEACRGAGLGRRLLEQAEREFEARGCRNVSLQVGGANEAARAFYAASGYRPRRGYELLEKSLSPAPRSR